MDLEKLEAGLREGEERRLQIRRFMDNAEKELRLKVGNDGYTENDLFQDLRLLYREHFDNYNLRLAMRPLLNESIAAYEFVSVEEREAIRTIYYKFAYAGGLLSYILECAECLETSEDEDIFRLAMIAASIEDGAIDFRETDAVLAELAIAARMASINIEPHCTAIAEMSSNVQSSGGGLTKMRLASFHLYAPKAVRLVPDDWINKVELLDDGRERW